MTDDDTLNRVRTHIGTGHLQEALDLCLPLANAGNAESIYLLAVISAHGGVNDQALNLYQEALKLLPGRSDILYNFGVFLRETNEWDGAIEAWMQASRLNPTHWQASYNLGLVLSETGRDGEALEAYGQALQADPGNMDVLYNLGNAHFRLGQWEAAKTVYGRLLALRPAHTGARGNLGLTLMRCGQDAAAVSACREVVALAPIDVIAHVNLGHALLAAGDWAEAFRELEWRWQVQSRPKALDGVVNWEGVSLKSGTLVVYGEQGHGDAVQFLRFVPQAKAQVGEACRVVAMVHAPLVKLAARAAGVDEAVSLHVSEEALGDDVAAAIPLMSLPLVLEESVLRPLPLPPYIQPPRARPLRGDGMRIGLVWRGNSEHANDANRSCPLAALTPVLDAPGVHVYALQWGGLTEAEQKIASGRVNVADVGSDFDNFSEAAEILAGLDVLITADTAMAHVAGAIGVPVWVMLPLVSDWRWRGADGVSPWYPEAKLFQQSVGETDWSGVALRLVKALKSHPMRRVDP